MTDREIQERVTAAFDQEPVLTPAAIGVAVRGGIVTLSGSVVTLQERWAAERAAQQVPEVRAVANDLEILSARSAPRTDAAIVRAIANTLSWYTAVPANAIHANVHDGWVKLSGTVAHANQKLAAERVVRLIYGVQGVFSRIAVEEPHRDAQRSSAA
jgi:osmotically-inducible protein OsmY